MEKITPVERAMLAIVRAVEALAAEEPNDGDAAGARRAHGLPARCRGGQLFSLVRRIAARGSAYSSCPTTSMRSADHRPRDGAARRPCERECQHRETHGRALVETDRRPEPGRLRPRVDGPRRRPVRRAVGARPRHALPARRRLRAARGRGPRAHRARRLRVRGRPPTSCSAPSPAGTALWWSTATRDVAAMTPRGRWRRASACARRPAERRAASRPPGLGQRQPPRAGPVRPRGRLRQHD